MCVSMRRGFFPDYCFIAFRIYRLINVRTALDILIYELVHLSADSSRFSWLCEFGFGSFWARFVLFTFKIDSCLILVLVFMMRIRFRHWRMLQVDSIHHHRDRNVFFDHHQRLNFNQIIEEINNFDQNRLSLLSLSSSFLAIHPSQSIMFIATQLAWLSWIHIIPALKNPFYFWLFRLLFILPHF